MFFFGRYNAKSPDCSVVSVYSFCLKRVGVELKFIIVKNYSPPFLICNGVGDYSFVLIFLQDFFQQVPKFIVQKEFAKRGNGAQKNIGFDAPADKIVCRPEIVNVFIEPKIGRIKLLKKPAGDENGL